MGIKEVKNELKNFNKEKLIELVAELYKKDKSVKEFLDFYVSPNEFELFNKYRDKVFEAFYPLRGDKLKLKDGKNAISDFKKIGGSPQGIADLMLFYVETGVSFTNDFGDIYESFYYSIESTFSAALKLMEKENILSLFHNRASKIVDDSDGTGWGFHDTLFDIYSEYYPD